MTSSSKFEIFVILVSINLVNLNAHNVPPAVQPKHHQPTCQYKDFFYNYFQCDMYEAITRTNCTDFRRTSQDSPVIFIFYDVNSVEGFNLRRDVYIRMAVFMKSLRQRKGFENARLVLPPFYQLYHWNIAHSRRNGRMEDEIVFWNHFFDLESMRRYTEVLDLWQYFDIMRDCFGFGAKSKLRLDYVFKLRHFESMFASGKFEERFNVEEQCDREFHRSQGQFISLYGNFSIGAIHCVEFQGKASLLHGLFQKYVPTDSTRKIYSISVLNGETVLHDFWGGVDYWQARRSMRFNRYLVKVAQDFREEILGSSDTNDKTVRPDDWRDEIESRNAIGGNYLCAHLRRADFLHGREQTTPSLHSAATQIIIKLKEQDLATVFISSDCTGREFHDLKHHLHRYRVVKFTPSSRDDLTTLKPGGIAVIDQIVCSYARFFIGTYESTFTYRIYEEREIIGFPSDTTFNTFCKASHDSGNCSRNSVWPIVF